MSAISAMPAQIAQWLGQQAPLTGIVFIPEYPAVKKAVPLRQAIVAVGLENAAITDKFVANDNGILEQQEYCRTAKLRIRLGIHAPYSLGGEYCHSVFTKVTDCLTFGSDLEITQSAAGRITSDRDTDAFVLDCYFDVTADFCPAESSDLTFPSFISKDLLCGSHISNNDIHFSGTEKQKFTQPFVTGAYTGTDAATRSVTLGFAPRLVIVFAQDFPPTAAASGTTSQASYWGIAAASAAAIKTQGILLTATGFQVMSAGTQTIRNVLARLNEAGLGYGYIAWR
ncbi:MAG: hypothetical protein LBJ12_06265 [Oscillospiraceae bacterium]|jgi:hypothetical protein|nr:hypothetical protein [Oscillospiraceae bacterium]